MKKRNLRTVIYHGILFSVLLCTALAMLQFFQEKLPKFLRDISHFIFKYDPLPFIIAIVFVIIVSLIQIGLNNLDTNEIIRKDDVTDEWLWEDFKNAKELPFNYRRSDNYIYIINFNGIYIMRPDELIGIDVKEVRHTRSRNYKVNGYTRSTYHERDYYTYKVIIRAQKKNYVHKVTDIETARRIRDELSYFL